MNKSPIERACELLGGQGKLADAIGVTPQAVNQWVSKGVAPIERVKDIVRAIDGRVTAHELAPGIYPEGFLFPVEASTKPQRKRAAAHG